MTSLDAHWSAATLLARVRRHGRIENRLHYVRDVTFGEDASAIRGGSAPRMMAALHNVVLGWLHQRRWPTRAAALRHYAWCPVTEVLRLLGISLS